MGSTGLIVRIISLIVAGFFIPRFVSNEDLRKDTRLIDS